MRVPLQRFLFLLLLLAGLSVQGIPVKGQSGIAVIPGPIEVDQFPTMRFYLDVWDAEGNFVNSLQPGDIEIVENGQGLPAQSIKTVSTGLQVILAINVGPALASQASGVSEYKRLIDSLTQWAQAQPTDSLDDFSLSTPTGLFLIRDRDPQKFAQALAEYQPDLARLQPSLNSILQALDLATDPLDRPLMKRSILYITPALPASQAATLPDLAIRSQESGVRVNVWLIGQASTGVEGAIDPLQQFAESTGGNYFRISASAPLPEIEPIFQPLRQVYAVQYQSGIQKSGSHTLHVRVKLPEGSLTSADQNFNLTVEPPNPIFLSPPAQIQRSWNLSGRKGELADLSPDTVPLQILIEFPDQHPRAIKATRLYVDGQLVAENITEPFDRFEWSIASIEIPAQNQLQVEVTDEINLSGMSSKIPVEILVDQPAKTSLFDRVSERGMIAVLAMVVAGATLGLILSLTSTQRRLRWKRKQVNRQLQKDPVTQPVPVKQVAPRKTRRWFWQRRETGSHLAVGQERKYATAAPARLVALDDSEQPVTGGSIPITGNEMTFGSDPSRATQILNSSTVDGLHARIFRGAGDEFILADQDSVAGTWINYAPVTSTGARLLHGDLIHIGKVMFRFELSDPSKTPSQEVKIIDLEQTHGPE